jgi:LmbE family N-acetylglucosaminyl deacetylase
VRSFRLTVPGQRLSVLCLGAHSDDIEIGAGATILEWQAAHVRLDVHWCVLSASGAREVEARASAADFLTGVENAHVDTQGFRDGFFPAQSTEIKSWFEQLKGRIDPDVILTHRGDDAHQDHREVSRLTWNTFRDHLILEYEIPKWDGDLGRPNLYVPIGRPAMARKVEALMRHFGTQRSKHWFDEETFRGLARLRGMECRAPDGYAEGFVARKVMVG